VQVRGTDLVHLLSRNFAAAAEFYALESSGVQFNGKTMDSGVCHMAFFEDPDGNALVLHHRYAPKGDLPEGF
jgi:hypothetical protein